MIQMHDLIESYPSFSFFWQLIYTMQELLFHLKGHNILTTERKSMQFLFLYGQYFLAFMTQKHVKRFFNNPSFYTTNFMGHKIIYVQQTYWKSSLISKI